MTSVFWVGKFVDAVFFFLMFKICGYVWERFIFDKGNSDFEVYEDSGSPDYELLTEFQSQGPVMPFLGDYSEYEDDGRFIV